MPDKSNEGRVGADRGFAKMDERRRREISKKGGESVPAAKRSFSQDHALAAEAGRKGGQGVPASKRSFSQDKALATLAGRKGGQARSESQARARRLAAEESILRTKVLADEQAETFLAEEAGEDTPGEPRSAPPNAAAGLPSRGRDRG